MNHNFYENPTIPNFSLNNNIEPKEFNSTRNQTIYPMMEDIYIDTILNKNKGKNAKIYVTIPTSKEWLDKEFNGIIEETGKDHIIISNPNTGEWNIIPLMYIAYITITEPINYNNY